MISSQSAAVSVSNLLSPVSAANTAAATGSAWTSLAGKAGYIVITQHVGAVTGSIAGKIQAADDSSGTNAADITGATFTTVSSSNNVQTLVLPATIGAYIKYIGTIVTGPAIVGVSMQSSAQSV